MDTILQSLQQKAILLQSLSKNKNQLFEYINNNEANADEVFAHNEPTTNFRPVKMLRFLIAKQIREGKLINEGLVEEIKNAIEARDISKYYNLNQTVRQSLHNYKQSKSGMFPNWKQPFKVLFPFLNSIEDSKSVKADLNLLADEIIKANQLQNVKINPVAFEGPQNYGTDHVWMAIVPENAPNVQKAYQIFFTITASGLRGGIYRGHQLANDTHVNEEIPYDNWEDYLEAISPEIPKWKALNEKLNFSFQNDENEFQKRIDNTNKEALEKYFEILDGLVDDLELGDTENLVFSTSRNRLSFQVGKRICLNVWQNKFDFIAPESYVLSSEDKTDFAEPDKAILYKKVDVANILSHYEAIKDATEFEVERDNHTKPKEYDNAAFRKAVFDKEYRMKFLQSSIQNKYYLVGAFWDSDTPQDQTERFVKEGIWLNGYDNKFLKEVKSVAEGSKIAIKAAFVRNKKDSVMTIKARGTVTENLNDGQNLKVNWEKDFKPFEVAFGGYMTTIKEVKKVKHIDAIWNRIHNFRDEFILWLGKNKIENSNADNSYITALDMLCEILPYNIYESSDTGRIQILYEDLLKEQKVVGGKYYNEKAPSYGLKGFYSAAARKYIQFLNERNNMGQDIDNKKNYDAPINQILYGPPGTGKTYNTILEAAKIISKKEIKTYNEALEVFNNNLEDQIEFITFHQNYSYEDFIQGLRPDVKKENISFNRVDGIFTKIAVNALFEYYKVFQKKQREGLENEKPIDINEAYIEFLNHLEKDQEFNTRTGEKVKITDFTDRQNIEFKPLKGNRPYLVSGNRLLKLYKTFPEIDDIQRVSEDIRGAIGGCNATIYYVALREFINFLNDYAANENILDDLDDQDSNYEDITYLRKKELLANIDLSDLRTIKSSEVPNYVIIIDEINRANISRVFGELITLIEEDKRSHGKIPLGVTLPSGEMFIVPSNLYIIGTMNTADKSIALLDIALRRRFEFVPMYPIYELDDDIINEPDLIKKINSEIINRKGYDFTIGHSYFMGEEFSLENAINNKVLPLLLEYFMNDHIEVKKILNKCGILLKEEWPMKYEGLKND